MLSDWRSRFSSQLSGIQSSPCSLQVPAAVPKSLNVDASCRLFWAVFFSKSKQHLCHRDGTTSWHHERMHMKSRHFPMKWGRKEPFAGLLTEPNGRLLAWHDWIPSSVLKIKERRGSAKKEAHQQHPLLPFEKQQGILKTTVAINHNIN